MFQDRKGWKEMVQAIPLTREKLAFELSEKLNEDLRNWRRGTFH